MDLLITAAVAALLGLLAVLLWVVLRAQRRQPALRQADLYGPLPERDVDEAEPTEPPGGGQVTPGAVTPAWAGSSEAYYDATGVGQGGPEHRAGPPPVAHRPDAGGSDWDDDERRRGIGPLPFVAAAGAGVGLLIFVVLRRRARRKSRVQRLRAGARALATSAGATVVRAAAGAAAVPGRVDRPVAAGSGMALAMTLAVLGVVRQVRARRRRRDELRRLAEAALATKGNGWVRGERVRQWLAAKTKGAGLSLPPKPIK
jgi:hypothetical protein